MVLFLFQMYNGIDILVFQLKYTSWATSWQTWSQISIHETEIKEKKMWKKPINTRMETCHAINAINYKQKIRKTSQGKTFVYFFLEFLWLQMEKWLRIGVKKNKNSLKEIFPTMIRMDKEIQLFFTIWSGMIWALYNRMNIRIYLLLWSIQ